MVKLHSSWLLKINHSRLLVLSCHSSRMKSTTLLYLKVIWSFSWITKPVSQVTLQIGSLPRLFSQLKRNDLNLDTLRLEFLINSLAAIRLSWKLSSNGKNHLEFLMLQRLLKKFSRSTRKILDGELSNLSGQFKQTAKKCVESSSRLHQSRWIC